MSEQTFYYYKFKDGSGHGTSLEPIVESENVMPITKEEYDELMGVTNEEQGPKFTHKQLKSIYQKTYKIKSLKNKLASSDYQAIKFAEGEMTSEEYAPMKEQRRQWRAEINQLQAELDAELNNQE